MNNSGKSNAIVEFITFIIVAELIITIISYILAIIVLVIAGLISIILYYVRTNQIKSLKEKCQNMKITLPNKSCTEYCKELEGIKIKNSKNESFKVDSLSIRGFCNGVLESFDFYKLKYMSLEEFEANSKLQIEGKAWSGYISVLTNNNSNDFKLTFKLSFQDQFILTYKTLKTIIELYRKEKQREVEEKQQKINAENNRKKSILSSAEPQVMLLEILPLTHYINEAEKNINGRFGNFIAAENECIRIDHHIKWLKEKKQIQDEFGMCDDATLTASEIESAKINLETAKNNKLKLKAGEGYLFELKQLLPLKRKFIQLVKSLKKGSDDIISEYYNEIPIGFIEAEYGKIIIFHMFCAFIYDKKDHYIRLVEYEEFKTDLEVFTETVYKTKKDDEIVSYHWQHENIDGKPDGRYSYNPATYNVYRAKISISCDYAHGIIEFSNRSKATDFEQNLLNYSKLLSTDFSQIKKLYFEYKLYENEFLVNAEEIQTTSIKKAEENDSDLAPTKATVNWKQQLAEDRKNILLNQEPSQILYPLPQKFTYKKKAEEFLNKQYYEYIEAKNELTKARGHYNWMTRVLEAQKLLKIKGIHNIAEQDFSITQNEIEELNKKVNSLKWRNPKLTNDYDSKIIGLFISKISELKSNSSTPQNSQFIELIRDFISGNSTIEFFTNENYSVFLMPYYIVVQYNQVGLLRIFFYNEIQIAQQNESIIIKSTKDNSFESFSGEKSFTLSLKAEEVIANINKYKSIFNESYILSSIRDFIVHPEKYAVKNDAMASYSIGNGIEIQEPKQEQAIVERKISYSKPAKKKHKSSYSLSLMDLSPEEKQMIIESRKKKAELVEQEKKQKESLAAQTKMEFNGINPIEQADGNNVITNNIINLSFRQVVDTPNIHRYRMYFVDNLGNIKSNDIIFEKQECGSITKLVFKLAAIEALSNSGDLFLLIKNSENDELIGKLNYKVKISFINDFGL